MSIIGIIASERQANRIRKEIKQDLEIELININYRSIENIKNIKFKIIIIQDSFEKLKEKQEYIKQILKSAQYVLVNTDIAINENIFKEINAKILTYGLKQKSTITVSGLEEKQIIISIQRSFKNIKGKMISEQEIPVYLEKNGTRDLYNSLIKMSIMNLFSTENR